MKRNSHFAFRKYGDTCFLKSSNTLEGKIIFLNETSTFMWEKMEDGFSADDLVKALMSVYNVDEKVAEHDVSEFISFLKLNGCLLIEE